MVDKMAKGKRAGNNNQKEGLGTPVPRFPSSPRVGALTPAGQRLAGRVGSLTPGGLGLGSSSPKGLGFPGRLGGGVEVARRSGLRQEYTQRGRESV